MPANVRAQLLQRLIGAEEALLWNEPRSPDADLERRLGSPAGIVQFGRRLEPAERHPESRCAWILPFDLSPSIVVRRAVLDGDQVRLKAEGTATESRCLACGTATTRMHDRYARRPMDLPWHRWTLRLTITVRSFSCDEPACPRVAFAEEIGAGVPRRAQRTRDVTAPLRSVVNVASGEKGARLAAAMGVPTGPDTLLPLERTGDSSAAGVQRMLGIDDLALRRGHTYATLFVERETRRPVDVVAGRDASVVADWLRAHPGVEVIVRDRVGAYVDGARAGAPEAAQGADRFLLMHIQNTR